MKFDSSQNEVQTTLQRHTVYSALKNTSESQFMQGRIAEAKF